MNSDTFMKSCRICLSDRKPLCPLFRYKLSGNYAEMLTAIADVKVSSSDGLPEKICLRCCNTLEKAFLLKTVAERSDRKLRKMLEKEKHINTKKIAFDSFTDIKSEIGPLKVKTEPTWDMEVDTDLASTIETVDTKDIVIADTIIRKVDSNNEARDDEAEVTFSKPSSSSAEFQEEYLEDDLFQDDDRDADYLPPIEKPKTKFKKPKLSDIKVFRGKSIIRKIKVLKRIGEDSSSIRVDGRTKTATTITCYPIMKNGSRGNPILLKRPKDATIKLQSSYPRPLSGAVEVVRGAGAAGRQGDRDKPLRVPRAAPVTKQREKLVCPICGILTYTLGNHIATHEEKKKYTCNQCPRTFSQKGNWIAHSKQHSGIKDHICEICGAGFYSQKSLVRHNLIHKGERPFGCNLCSKKFIARCDLNRHLRIHSGYKPFKCTACTMSFNARHQLQNHERMHTGERPYTCEVCNVAFTYKVNLNNHVMKVHGVNIKFKSIHVVTEDVLRRELGETGLLVPTDSDTERDRLREFKHEYPM